MLCCWSKQKIHNTHCTTFPVWLILLAFFLFPGDKERPMEVEQEGKEEMKMVLNCPPIHPLPEEIKKGRQRLKKNHVPENPWQVPCWFYFLFEVRSEYQENQYGIIFTAQTCINCGTILHLTVQNDMSMEDHIDTTYVGFFYIYIQKHKSVENVQYLFRLDECFDTAHSPYAAVIHMIWRNGTLFPLFIFHLF